MRDWLRKRAGLVIIVLAAALLELLSGAQYLYTHQLLEETLEKRVESELTLKAILIKSTLNSAEDILKNHIWDIRQNLEQPDSVMEALGRMIVLSRTVHGVGLGFVPYYYPEKGRLFEPYVQKIGDSIVKRQIAGPDHDYLSDHPYQATMAANDAVWIEPYLDQAGAQTSVISYLMPFRDKSDKLAGMVGIDVSLQWLGDTIGSHHFYPSSFVLCSQRVASPSSDLRRKVSDRRRQTISSI